MTDANDNPVADVGVSFTVASGGGSVTGESVQTDANGIATVGSWTLGATAGENSLSATAAGLAEPVTFTATGNTAPAAPTDVTAAAGNAEVMVSWMAPSDIDGSPITGYGVTAEPGGQTCTTTGETSCTVTG